MQAQASFSDSACAYGYRNSKGRPMSMDLGETGAVNDIRSSSSIYGFSGSGKFRTENKPAWEMANWSDLATSVYLDVLKDIECVTDEEFYTENQDVAFNPEWRIPGNPTPWPKRSISALVRLPDTPTTSERAALIEQAVTCYAKIQDIILRAQDLDDMLNKLRNIDVNRGLLQKTTLIKAIRPIIQAFNDTIVKGKDKNTYQKRLFLQRRDPSKGQSQDDEAEKYRFLQEKRDNLMSLGPKPLLDEFYRMRQEVSFRNSHLEHRYHAMKVLKTEIEKIERECECCPLEFVRADPRITLCYTLGVHSAILINEEKDKFMRGEAGLNMYNLTGEHTVDY